MALALETNRQDFQDLFSLYMAIGIAIAALVLLTIAFVVLRYRQREGRDPRRPDSLLRVLEGTWAAAIAGIVVVLLISTFTTEDRVDAVPGDPARTVRVTGFQWGWRFSYPGTGVAVTGNSERPPTLVVPADVEVRFEISSRDVIHSFWVPALRFKRDAFPDRVSDFDLVVDPGVSTTGHCAEFCGLGHDRMDFQLVSMDPSAFDAWLRHRERRAAAAAGGA